MGKTKQKNWEEEFNQPICFQVPNPEMFQKSVCISHIFFSCYLFVNFYARVENVKGERSS